MVLMRVPDSLRSAARLAPSLPMSMPTMELGTPTSTSPPAADIDTGLGGGGGAWLRSGSWLGSGLGEGSGLGFGLGDQIRRQRRRLREGA